ncbi:YTH domain-containing protein ECT1 [Musa acuminata AAA Group]|uniref:YTH domain-containing protein ECT1 n=1 Tax=Musa acuminata AAA Group TaxID=214697 RepID=UPI0031D3511A
METSQQALDRIEPLESSTVDGDQKPVTVETLNEQPPSAIDEKVTTSNASDESSNIGLPRDAQDHFGSSDAVNDDSIIFPPNNLPPPAHVFWYRGYENPIADEYSRHLNVEGLEVGSTGVYNENRSLVYHTGYGYSPQMPYGPYSPATTPLPSISGDGQLYTPQQFQFPGAYYQQPAPPNMPFLSSPTPIPQADLTMPIDQQGAFPVDTSSFNTHPFGPRPGYQLSYGSFGRDWLRSPEGTGSVTPLSPPAASPQPVGALMSFGQNTMPPTYGMASQQHRSLYGFGSSINSPHGGLYHGSIFETSFPSFGFKDQSLIALDRRSGGKGTMYSRNGNLDFLNEQNRGPRASRTNNQMTEHNPSLDNGNSSSRVDQKLYNNPDFITEYKDAKFFVIKSYSEDNVHKSIKYGVWASTSNGNKKLDSAYHEANKKEDPCPVFLFFSVNASAHFCGVAEMIGPVDFEKSVDYWQQDKWSGQFPVKWQIVKDVPNNLFRHIILENNDNKPVTNSRDTQEVKLEQGLEMLSIFKKHEYEVSILDDFEFYEEREKAMQERKSHQHQQQLSNSAWPVPAALRDDQRNTATMSGEFIGQISEKFTHAVTLEERSNADPSTDKNSSLNTAVASMPKDL